MVAHRCSLALAVLLTLTLSSSEAAYASTTLGAQSQAQAQRDAELEPSSMPNSSSAPVEAVDAKAETITETHTSCVAPVPSGRWYGRSNDDEWARGLYPARERYAGKLALTFDDGPHLSRTTIALDELGGAGMPATFFLTGNAIRSSTYELVQRMVAEGHVLANHGWRHDTNMAQMVDDAAELEAYIGTELELTQIRVDMAMLASSAEDFKAMDTRVFAGLQRFRHDRAQQLARMPKLRARHRELLLERGYSETKRPYALTWIRPPGGNPYIGKRWTHAERRAFARVVNAMGLTLVMWNGGSGDSNTNLSPAERRDPERVAETARKAAQTGGIYVAHDRIEPDALRAMLRELAGAKADVVGLEELRAIKLEAMGLCD